MYTPSISSIPSITPRYNSSEEGDNDPTCVGECIPVFDESTALLSSADQNVVESQLPKPAKMTPIPKLALVALCLIRLLEPLGFTQLFPYINEMLVDLNMVDDPSKVGFVSGLVVSDELFLKVSILTVNTLSGHPQESVSAVFQLISIYHWTKVSDAVGRRPIILFGALGMGFMTLLFGFSHNLTHMFITRSLYGFFAG